MRGVLLLALVGTTLAHNWLHTPSRATFQASTTKPCLGRKDSDLHAQIGPGQKFAFKWAVGHDRESWVIVVAGKDAAWLAASNLLTMTQQYIDQAPAGNNYAATAAGQRRHGSPSASSNGDYQATMTSADPYWIDHPRAPTVNMYQWKATAIASDRRVNYANTNFPWIESVGKFTHLYHQPNDYDAIMIDIAARSGPGHYIVHWYWSGYYDCVDVDVRTSAVAQVNGIVGAGWIYNRMDHCQYLEPLNIETPCMEAPVTAQVCQEALPGWKTSDRLGINIVPLFNPSKVWSGFADQINIPWFEPNCVGDTWTLMTGLITRSAISWSTWNSNTATTAGVKCTGVLWGPTKLDLSTAVARCNKGCTGISWEKLADAQTYPSTGTYNFIGCSSTATAANTSWTTFVNNVATPATTTGPTIRFSFQPNSVNNGAPLRDTGWLFGAHMTTTDFTGKYGWNCPNPCEWCCQNYAWPCSTQTEWLTFSASSGPDPCDGYGGDHKKWEAEFASGVYRIGMYVDSDTDPTVGVQGCAFENVRMADDNDFGTAVKSTLTKDVEITDGRLTLSGDGGTGNWEFCERINVLTVQKVSTGHKPAWHPADSNPWWQMELTAQQPIGVVTVKTAPQTDQSHWWLYRGNKLQPTGMALGDFNDTANEGAIVRISNSSCSGTTCPGVVCGRIFTAPPWQNQERNIWCKGQFAKYISIQLPGSTRVLANLAIRVNRASPLPSTVNADTKVCYGVTARTQTSTTPEYLTTTDMEDPIFYSTCIVREANISWLPLPPTPPEPTRWRFHGNCLDCANYRKNNMPTPSPLHFKSFTPADNDRCINCDQETAPLAVSDPWTKIYDLTRCNPDATAPGNTCGASCTKYLYPGARKPDSTIIAPDTLPKFWAANRITFDECYALVARDPECSDIAEFDFNPWTNQCRCYKKDACCGRCTPQTWTGSTIKLYKVAKVAADPTCASGRKSADGTVCCPSYCTKNGDGVTNICGVSWQCYAYVQGGGTCCKEGLANSCATSGPPCLM